MSTVEAPSLAHTSAPNALGAVGSWLTTTDHRRIGRMFIGAAAVWMATMVVVSTLLGIERIASDSTLLPADSILQLFALVRTLASFGVMIPLFIGLAIVIVPMQVGARAISFARVALLGFYLWLIGSGLIVGAIAGNGGPGGGSADMVEMYLLGLAMCILGVLAAAVSLFTTVLAGRTSGLTLTEVPMLAWSALVAATALILALPVLLGTLIFVAVDHHYERIAFGGTDGVMTWLGWAFTQPQTFIYVVIALGVLADMTPVVARAKQPLRSAVVAALGLTTTAVVGTVAQTTHVFSWAGSLTDKAKNLVPYALYNLLPLLGLVVVLATSLLALVAGKPKIIAPYIAAFLGIGMIMAGMIGNAVQRIEPAGLAGTVFDEAALTYLTYGSMLVMWGALTFWGPRMTGRMIPNSAVVGIAVLGFLATVLASLPYYIAGFVNQPADSVSDFNFGGPQALWSVLSAAGHALMALCVFAAIATMIRSSVAGTAASEDPWDARTLEWSVDGGAR
jgi:heme/copper-type cytochrome/quinol oxidase subunit 1